MPIHMPIAGYEDRARPRITDHPLRVGVSSDKAHRFIWMALPEEPIALNDLTGLWHSFSDCRKYVVWTYGSERFPHRYS